MGFSVKNMRIIPVISKNTLRMLGLGSALSIAVLVTAPSVQAQQDIMAPMPNEAQEADIIMPAVPAAPVSSEDNKVSTLRDAVSVGVATNPEYGVVAASRRATDEELNQGEALFLPSIDLNGDTGFEYSDDPATRGGLDDDDTESMFRSSVRKPA